MKSNETRHSPDQITAHISGSTSLTRQNALKNQAEIWVGPDVRVHGIGPETDCGIPEPENPIASQVAWEKLVTLQIAMGQLEPSVIGQAWAYEVQRVTKEEKHPTIDPTAEPFAIWTSDVVARVGTEPDQIFETSEILKLQRDLKHLAPEHHRERSIIVSRAKKEAHELYSTRRHFYVLFRVAVVGWTNLGHMSVQESEIFMRFKKVPKRVVNQAFGPGGTVWYSGPRLDLAALAQEYADVIMIRNADQADEIWQPFTAGGVVQLVKDGILPRVQMNEFLKLMSQTEGSVSLNAPDPVAVDWTPAPQLDQFAQPAPEPQIHISAVESAEVA